MSSLRASPSSKFQKHRTQCSFPGSKVLHLKMPVAMAEKMTATSCLGWCWLNSDGGCVINLLGDGDVLFLPENLADHRTIGDVFGLEVADGWFRIGNDRLWGG